MGWDSQPSPPAFPSAAFPAAADAAPAAGAAAALGVDASRRACTAPDR